MNVIEHESQFPDVMRKLGYPVYDYDTITFGAAKAMHGMALRLNRLEETACNDRPRKNSDAITALQDMVHDQQQAIAKLEESACNHRAQIRQLYVMVELLQGVNPDTT